jgi:hypothetical protein
MDRLKEARQLLGLPLKKVKTTKILVPVLYRITELNTEFFNIYFEL